MSRLRARVQNGRLVLDEATDLPEGTEVDLVPADGWDDLGDDERRKLEEALACSDSDVEEGRLESAPDILERLRLRA